ncbi:MAG: hypothetical protein U5K56_05505 [Halioglobus sp.]|nr:hypothetical protein [Halioglobus sp.]
MSRLLIPVLLCLVAGCALTTSPADIDTGTADRQETPTADEWLLLLQQVQSMPEQKALKYLVREDRPENTEQRYYYALLNQRLETYGAWTQARDTLRALQQNDSLTIAQRQLVDLLLAYNQSRINWYLSYQELQAQNIELQEQLRSARRKTEQLQQKIQALTDLETVISTRKEE